MKLLDAPPGRLKLLMQILDLLDDSQVEILLRWAKGEADFAKGAIVYYTDARDRECRLFITDDVIDERPGVIV